MKILKKSLFLILMIVMLLSIMAYTNADTNYSGTTVADIVANGMQSQNGKTTEGSDQGLPYLEQDPKNGKVKGGTIVEIVLSNGESYSCYEEAGQGSSTIKGQNPFSSGADGITSGDIFHSAEDYIEYLRYKRDQCHDEQAGRILEQIENETVDFFDAHLKAGCTVIQNGDGTVWAISELLDEIYDGNPDASMQERYGWYLSHAGKYYDELENLSNLGRYHYELKKKTQPPSEPTPTDTPTDSQTPTKTPTPTPHEEADYKLQYKSDKGRKGDVKGSLRIYDPIFHVEVDENPIPTGEDVYIDGKTNYVGEVVKMEEWELVVTKLGDVAFTATWDIGYKERWVDYTRNPQTGFPEHTDPDWSEHPWKDNESHNIPEGKITVGEEGGDHWTEYETKEWKGTLTVVTTPKGVTGTIPYNAFHDAKVVHNLSATVKNAVLDDSTTFIVNGPSAKIVEDTTILPNASPKRVSEGPRTYELPNVYTGTDEEAVKKQMLQDAKDTKVPPEVYYNVSGDVNRKVTYGSSNPVEVVQNDYLLTDQTFKLTNLVSFSEGVPHTVPQILNKSRDAQGSYTSNGWFTKSDGENVGSNPAVNPVGVHTPIVALINVASESKNQLMNHNIAPMGSKIVTIGEPFSARINFTGNAHYYKPIDTTKYIKTATYQCELCGTSGVIIDSDKNIGENPFEHSCIVSINCDDCQTKYFTVTVTAKNVDANPGKVSPVIGRGSTNDPDNQYTIEQKYPIFVVGKMYDFEVRTTDDPGWNLSSAQKLSQLPIGEYGDNANKQYTAPIKLGYRAYFDLKTLSSATKSVAIQPKLIYVDTAGNIDPDVSFWYRSTAGYTKLASKDISIRMNMSNTKGNINNEVNFSAEQTERLKTVNINYNKTLTIGGLSSLILSQDNSTSTLYKSGDESKFHPKCIRWYGEVYVPASTIVATKDATVTQVAAGTNTKKSGFVVVIFDKVFTTVNDNNKLVPYLGYHIAKDVNWSDQPHYILLEEKVTTVSPSGEVAGLTIKDKIVLPNGKAYMNGKTYPAYTNTGDAIPITQKPYAAGLQAYLADYLRTDLPVIVYDVSLRANNDAESGGTH